MSYKLPPGPRGDAQSRQKPGNKKSRYYDEARKRMPGSPFPLNRAEAGAADKHTRSPGLVQDGVNNLGNRNRKRKVRA